MWMCMNDNVIVWGVEVVVDVVVSSCERVGVAVGAGGGVTVWRVLL